MIHEHYRGNLIVRSIALAVGAADLFREYEAPELLDHLIEQPSGIAVRLKGPKRNLTVTCEISRGTFQFSEIVPPNIRFELHDSRNSYLASYKEKTIKLPINTRKLHQHPVYSMLHEGGHLWQVYDEPWYKQYEAANETLWEQLFSRAIDGEVWLPEDPIDRRKHLSAWKILGDGEQRAAATALYTIGLLRKADIHVIPPLQTAASLAQQVNIGLKSHEVFDMPLTFTEKDVAGFLNGNFGIQPVADLVKERVDGFVSKFKKPGRHVSPVTQP